MPAPNNATTATANEQPEEIVNTSPIPTAKTGTSSNTVNTAPHIIPPPPGFASHHGHRYNVNFESFSGRGNATEFWAMFMAFVTLQGMPKVSFILILPFHLTGKAREWFSVLDKKHKVSLTSIKEAFLKRFKPLIKRGVKLTDLKQGDTESVDEYIHRAMSFNSENSVYEDFLVSITEKECLAIIRGVESYRPYLANSHFTIVTDHSALTWLKTAKLSRRLERCALKLQDLDYDIIHRPGTSNVVADCLSRRPYNEAPAIQSVTNARQESEPDSEWLPNGWQTYTTFYYDDESPENCPVISALEADQLPEHLANHISLFEKQIQCPDVSDIIKYLQDRKFPEDEKLSRAIVSESPY
ncbi:unnamed protein product [Mytilus edulis]|uniref:Reverse transcriptase RNase H-like domain-containing protein n=1 Tax=Mytilus edulis TaxID=6550 RepID=A0A8S3TUS4_MYTED|nr:unnamed protein product [Mytilus edulis]